METTERIVEAYVRYIMHWATIPNIRCHGQHEIDLLAISPVGDRTSKKSRYHIESGVSISQVYSKLTAKPFSREQLHTRGKKAGQRRTLDYFIHQKFEHPDVLATLETYGFTAGNYSRVIVTWGWEDDVPGYAKERSILLWDFRHLLQELAKTLRSTRKYYTDDTLRTLQLFTRAE